MEYTIENLDSMRLVGFKIRVESQKDKTEKIQAYWMEKFQNGEIPTFLQENNATQNDLIGVSCNVDDNGSFDYLIALKSDMPVRDGLEAVEVAASKYIVLKGTNSEIGDMFCELFTNIIPNGGHNVGDVSLELYKVDGECEIYTAIN